MKGRLIKRDNDFYSLRVDELVMATSNGMIVDYKLSLKNCQAIENGYDLDELADEYNGHPIAVDWQLEKRGFKAGFKKALEILGDKKFSVLDIQNVIDSNEDSLVYQTISENGDISFCLDEDVLIQSLQQTEWDVEIITKPYTEVNEGFELESKREPKLDKDGCLILKRSV